MKCEPLQRRDGVHTYSKVDLGKNVLKANLQIERVKG